MRALERSIVVEAFARFLAQVPVLTGVAGVLAGFLVHSGLIDDPIVAMAAIQEILKRPLGPEARAIIPVEAGA